MIFFWLATCDFRLALLVHVTVFIFILFFCDYLLALVVAGRGCNHAFKVILLLIAVLCLTIIVCIILTLVTALLTTAAAFIVEHLR